MSGELTRDQVKEVAQYLLQSAGLSPENMPRQPSPLAAAIRNSATGSPYRGCVSERLMINCYPQGVDVKVLGTTTWLHFTWSQAAKLVLAETSPNSLPLF